MRKIKKNKIENTDILKKENIIFALNGLKKIMDKNLYDFFECLIDNCSEHREEIVSLVKDALFWIAIKDRNKKAKFGITLVANIENFCNYIKDNLIPSINMQVFSVLFELNHLLAGYSCYDNKLLKEMKLISKEDDYKEFSKFFSYTQDFGYEPYFTGKIQNQFIDTLNWMAKSISRLIKYNPRFFIKDTLFKVIDDKLEIISKVVQEKFIYPEEVLGLFNEECRLLNNILTRISFIRSSLTLLETNNKTILPLYYKKDIKHLKNTITRAEKLSNNLYTLMITGDFEENI